MSTLPSTPFVLVEAPALDNDTKRPPHARELAERRVVANLVAFMISRGFNLHTASDGEERAWVKSAKEVLEVVFSVDESWVYFRRPDSRRTYVVVCVLGNADDGSEVISDHSAPEDDSEGFGKAMDAFCAIPELFGEPRDTRTESSRHGLI